MNEANTFEHQTVAWAPSEDVMARARLTEFMRQVGAKTFDEVYRRSIKDVEWFHTELLKFLDIKFDPPYETLMDTSRGIEWTEWCKGGGLNITEMCLDRWQTDETRSQPAIIWEGEEGDSRSVTYEELLDSTENCAAALRASGLGKGDAVGIHLPMMVETVVAMLAINRIGAIAVPVFSGYGVSAIESRMNAVGAKAIFTCDGFPRRGKFFNAFEIAEQAIANCPTIEKVFVVTRGDKQVTSTLSIINYSSSLDQPEVKEEILYGTEPTLAEDPLIILYTSGTTGRPKGIAHTHCGFPIKAAQDMAFGTDVGRGTRISWYTDLGWMMGPWLIYGALINGATIVIYDGAPDFPTADRMWEFCAKHKVEILGISPTLVRALSACGDELPKKHDLSALRAFASTGEPWNPAPWWWLFEKVGDSKLPIINYSGGTEISGGILMGNPLLPIKPCSFPAPCLSIDADILDENGNSAPEGSVGELAIRKPWIGMARGFWQEPERYLDTYWRRFPGIWVHGDWALRDDEGHWYILGRSDDTLKVAGKRVGPAEVESLLVAHERVTEAAVIGVPDEMKSTAMVAFCVLTASAQNSPPYEGGVAHEVRRGGSHSESSPPFEGGVRLQPGGGYSELESELKALVAKDMGKPLAPSRIHFVSALPKTRNAKVMRRVIRAAYLGLDPGDLSALENPGAVEEIKLSSKK
ncbi:MAG TPA: AMP-binding protein [Pyrinomonadaceae bacterium]|jgi:acetyl-CoA synthetase|nr:AMP-binding protein [Pyrinomonadaceae bacterium]